MPKIKHFTPIHSYPYQGNVSIDICIRAAGKWKDMVKIADSALYQAKNNGRNTVSAVK